VNDIANSTPATTTAAITALQTDSPTTSTNNSPKASTTATSDDADDADWPGWPAGKSLTRRVRRLVRDSLPSAKQQERELLKERKLDERRRAQQEKEEEKRKRREQVATEWSKREKLDFYRTLLVCGLPRIRDRHLLTHVRTQAEQLSDPSASASASTSTPASTLSSYRQEATATSDAPTEQSPQEATTTTTTATEATADRASIEEEKSNFEYDWPLIQQRARLARKSIELILEYHNQFIEYCTRKSQTKAGEVDEIAESMTTADGEPVATLSIQQCKRVLQRIDVMATLRDTVMWSEFFEKTLANLTVQGQLPSWWQRGPDDRALLCGVHKHGVGQWDAICADPSLPFLVRVQAQKANGASGSVVSTTTTDAAAAQSTSTDKSDGTTAVNDSTDGSCCTNVDSDAGAMDVAAQEPLSNNMAIEHSTPGDTVDGDRSSAEAATTSTSAPPTKHDDKQSSEVASKSEPLMDGDDDDDDGDDGDEDDGDGDGDGDDEDEDDDDGTGNAANAPRRKRRRGRPTLEKFAALIDFPKERVVLKRIDYIARTHATIATRASAPEPEESGKKRRIRKRKDAAVGAAGGDTEQAAEFWQGLGMSGENGEPPEGLKIRIRRKKADASSDAAAAGGASLLTNSDGSVTVVPEKPKRKRVRKSKASTTAGDTNVGELADDMIVESSKSSSNNIISLFARQQQLQHLQQLIQQEHQQTLLKQQQLQQQQQADDGDSLDASPTDEGSKPKRKRASPKSKMSVENLIYDVASQEDEGDASSKTATSGDMADKDEQSKRNRRPRNSKTKTCIAYAKTDDGAPALPLQLGPMELVSLGTVVYDREGFHNKNYIWPAGFQTTRKFKSFVTANSKCVYRSEILDLGGPHPSFQVTADDAQDRPFTGHSPSNVWVKVLEAIQAQQGSEARKISVSGPEYFGLANGTVAKVHTPMLHTKVELLF
jgi:hypothetical protein